MNNDDDSLDEAPAHIAHVVKYYALLIQENGFELDDTASHLGAMLLHTRGGLAFMREYYRLSDHRPGWIEELAIARDATDEEIARGEDTWGKMPKRSSLDELI